MLQKVALLTFYQGTAAGWNWITFQHIISGLGSNPKCPFSTLTALAVSNSIQLRATIHKSYFQNLSFLSHRENMYALQYVDIQIIQIIILKLSALEN